MFSQNSVHALETEFDKLSKLLGNKNVRTTFSGDGAYTNGEVVNVPEMDRTRELDPRHQAIMRGYHIHEVSHVTDSDMSILKRRTVKESPELKDTWNCVEDVFVERKAQEKYAGARRSLEVTVDSVLEAENKHWADNPEENVNRRKRWWTEIPYAALQQARSKMGYDSEALEEYLDEMPKELAKQADKWSDKMLKCQNTEESLRTARAIKKVVDKYEDENPLPPPPPPKPSEGDGNKSDDNTTSQQSKSGDNKSDDNKSDSKSNDSKGDDKGDNKDDGKQKPREITPEAPWSELTPEEKIQRREQRMEAHIKAQEQAEEERQAAESKGKGFVLSDALGREKKANEKVFRTYSSGFASRNVEVDLAPVYRDHEEAWNHLPSLLPQNEKGKRLFGNLSTVFRIRRDNGNYIERTKVAKEHLSCHSSLRQYSARLRRLLLAREDRRNEGGYNSGRVDPRRLSQLVAGCENIFSRSSVLQTDETRVMIAVDGSGSMDKNKTQMAVLALNECLGRANVKFDICEWASVEGQKADRVNGRTQPFVVHHKKANESWKKLDKVFEYNPFGGYTPTASVVYTMATIMKAWREPRKILFFVTDGLPNGAYSGEPRVVRKYNDAMIEHGIEVIGVGVYKPSDPHREHGEACLKQMFKHHVICDFNTFGETLLGGIEKLLIKEGHANAA